MGKGKMPDLGQMMADGGAAQQPSLSARPGAKGKKKKRKSKAGRR
jgi:hypothetical protein